jgi:hypothetical protein
MAFVIIWQLTALRIWLSFGRKEIGCAECGSQYMMYFCLRISWTQKDDRFVGFENQLEAKKTISLLEPA